MVKWETVPTYRSPLAPVKKGGTKKVPSYFILDTSAFIRGKPPLKMGLGGIDISMKAFLSIDDDGESTYFHQN
jgi:hypothetical protein